MTSHINNIDLTNDKPAWLIQCCIILCCTLYISSANADAGDTFNTVLSTSYVHDDNLFRLDSGQQPSNPEAERSDNVLKTSIGFKVNKKYSLQVFKFDFSHVETRYDQAKFLDFNANNYSAAWLWSLTPSLKGTISADRTVDLVPFIDNRNSNVQNQRVIERRIFDFDFSPNDVWHLLGGYTNLEVTNSQDFLPETSFLFDAVEGGVRYVFPSQSNISFKVRNRNGENQSVNFARLIGKGFNDKEAEISAIWLATDKSRVTSNIGYIKRTDDTFALRDYSGIFGGINYAWDVSGKLNLNIGLNRKLSSFQDVNSSYTSSDVFSIKPTWAVSSKIVVGANAQVGKRRFLGEGPLLSDVDREDKSLTYGVGIDWAPRSTIKLGLVFQHEDRDSNALDRDYSSNSVGVNGQLTF